MDNFSAVLNLQTNAVNNPPILNTPKDNCLTQSSKCNELIFINDIFYFTIHSILVNGADINRSYLDANKSDYSINDLSLWFNQRRYSMPASLSLQRQVPLSVLAEVPSQDELNHHQEHLVVQTRETEMTNFKLLLNKVKEIVEDSYSDNTELSEATQNLENVLDSIIKTEEVKRKSFD